MQEKCYHIVVSVEVMGLPPAPVSAVIPTLLAASLEPTLLSVLGQTRPPEEILVVVDGPVADASAVMVDPRVRVLFTGVRSNANVARNLGVRSARAPFVALLDDDDLWFPTKLEDQLAAVPATVEHWLMTSSVEARLNGRSSVWPDRALKEQEDLSEYLFVRRGLRGRTNSLQTSSWLAPRATFALHPFDEDLYIHQDYDWLIRNIGSVRLVQVPKIHVRYARSASSGMTSSGKWERSARWVSGAGPMTRRAKSDFLLCATSIFLARSGRIRAIVPFLRLVFRYGRPAALPAVVFAGRIVQLLRAAGEGRVSRAARAARGVLDLRGDRTTSI